MPPQQLPAPLWRDHRACATPLLVSFLDHYGPEAVQWTPLTIHMELDEELGSAIAAANFNKLMAGLALLRDNSFYKSCPDFVMLCLALSGEPAGLVADAGDCAWGLTEGMLLAPPDRDDATPFTDEIRSYIGHALDAEGILVPPDILKLALRDRGDLARQVQYDYADDPVLFASIQKTEDDKTGAINAMVRARMALLLQQLVELKLQHGNSSKIARQLLARLESTK